MGIREENKLETRNKILDSTARLIQINGFVKVSTKEISEASGVSQGSIFLHFKTKDQLLFSILESNLELLRNDLEQSCDANSNREQFIREFINVMIDHENMMSRALKDYPYLPEELQKIMDDLDTLIKNLLFDNLNKNLSTGLNIIDSFILIDAFISQIKMYFHEKNENSVSSLLKQRRGRILKLYKMLFPELS